MNIEDFAHQTWGQIPKETQQALALSRYLNHCKRYDVEPWPEHLENLPPVYLLRVQSEHARVRRDRRQRIQLN